jgi:hypothetical protein
MYKKYQCRIKTFEVESLFLWAFLLVLVRCITAAAAAAATAGVTDCDMYWEGFTLFMLKVISSDNFSFQSYQNKNL